MGKMKRYCICETGFGQFPIETLDKFITELKEPLQRAAIYSVTVLTRYPHLRNKTGTKHKAGT